MSMTVIWCRVTRSKSTKVHCWLPTTAGACLRTLKRSWTSAGPLSSTFILLSLTPLSYFAAGLGAKYCDERVCLCVSVCLFARMYQQEARLLQRKPDICLCVAGCYSRSPKYHTWLSDNDAAQSNKHSAVAEVGDRLARIRIDMGIFDTQFWGERGAGFPSNTWPGQRHTTVPNDILIHTSV